ncbi:uncharacterized protein LOC130670016 [Microplitis mediator]|uniref:uncharacterized protein LOC130670016 n=1 Tax=Microplitis mediator TaxID=375433 RepID=UPI002555AAE8|nr:uncharacterized protein LOC130670016 [Microplitis mediator]
MDCNFQNSTYTTVHSFELEYFDELLFINDAGTVSPMFIEFASGFHVNDVWSFKVEVSHVEEDEHWITLGILPLKSEHSEISFELECCVVGEEAVENDIGHNEDLSRENYPTASSTSHVEIIDQPSPIYESINRQDNNLQPIVVESNDHQNPDSIDVEVLGSQLQAANTSVTNDHSIDVPIIFNENFETLLLKLQVNIMTTQNNEEKKKKMIEMDKMLASLDMNMNDSCLPPATSNSVLQSNIGCLTIFSSHSRGRGRGRRNRVIGLSASQRSTKYNSFQNLKNTTKVIEILSLIIKDKSVINRIVLGYKKINHNDLIHLQPGNICDALASEIITDDIIEKFFEPDAYANYKNIIKMKCNSDDWQSKICGSNLNTDYSVECDRCLFWSHWRCVGLTEEPLNE